MVKGRATIQVSKCRQMDLTLPENILLSWKSCFCQLAEPEPCWKPVLSQIGQCPREPHWSQWNQVTYIPIESPTWQTSFEKALLSCHMWMFHCLGRCLCWLLPFLMATPFCVWIKAASGHEVAQGSPCWTRASRDCVFQTKMPWDSSPLQTWHKMSTWITVERRSGLAASMADILSHFQPSIFPFLCENGNNDVGHGWKELWNLQMKSGR